MEKNKNGKKRTKKNQVAEQILQRMHVCYGKHYEDMWKNVANDVLLKMVIYLISDLSNEQIKHGLKMMYKHAWPPSLPLFRQWCLRSSTQYSEDEAWLMAMSYYNSDGTTEITTFVKEALDQLRRGFGKIEDNSKCEKTFKDCYLRIINDEKNAGQTDKIIKPVKIKKIKENSEGPLNSQPIPMPDYVKELFGGIGKRINKNSHN